MNHYAEAIAVIEKISSQKISPMDIIYWVAKNSPGTLVKAARSVSGDEIKWDTVRDYCRVGKKVAAVKACRELFDMSLKDAVAKVNTLMKEVL